MQELILTSMDNPDISDKIIFNPSQRIYLENIFEDDLSIKMNHYKEFAVYGGYRAGKSFVQQLAMFLICTNPAYKNVRCIYVRNTYPELKDTVIPQFRDAFEKYGRFNYVESSKEGSHIAKFHDTGSEIRFRSADEPTKLLSAEYDVIALCQGEAISSQVIQILFGRWSGTRLPKKLMLNEGNPAGTWVKTEYVDKEHEELEKNGIFFLRVKTQENLHNIDSDFIEDYKRRNSELDYRRFIEGEFIGNDDMVFHQFSNDNIIDPINVNEIKYTYKKGIGGDYGQRNLATFVWGYKDPEGVITIYDSWGKPRQTAEEIANAGLKYGKQSTVYDYSCKGDYAKGYDISEWDRLTKLGLNLIECSKEDEAGTISYINSLLKQGLLKITSNNEELIWEINNWKYQPQRLGNDLNGKETPIDANNHYIDALKYLIKWLEGVKSFRPEDIAEKKSFATLVRSRPKRNILELG
jgi:PBSX family phage terminase large subunit